MNTRWSPEGDTAMLFAELNHRFFNSFQVIAALARQAGRASCADFAPLLEALDSRLVALAQVHRMLSYSATRDGIEQHCRTLCRHLVEGFGRSDRVELRFEYDDLRAEWVELLPLIVVEMVTNVLKHSLAGRPAGVITIALDAVPTGFELTVADTSGAPCPSPAPPPSRTVVALAKSLDGSAFVSDRDGYVAGVRLPRGARDTLDAALSFSNQEYSHPVA